MGVRCHVKNCHRMLRIDKGHSFFRLTQKDPVIYQFFPDSQTCNAQIMHAVLSLRAVYVLPLCFHCMENTHDDCTVMAPDSTSWNEGRSTVCIYCAFTVHSTIVFLKKVTNDT